VQSMSKLTKLTKLARVYPCSAGRRGGQALALSQRSREQRPRTKGFVRAECRE